MEDSDFDFDADIEDFYKEEDDDDDYERFIDDARRAEIGNESAYYEGEDEDDEDELPESYIYFCKMLRQKNFLRIKQNVHANLKKMNLLNRYLMMIE